MQQKYTKLLFDLDNTLVDDDENRKNAIKQILLERNEEISDKKLEEFIKLDNQFWKDRASGKIKDPYKFKTLQERTEWVRAQRFIKYFKNVSLEQAKKINNRYVEYLKDKIVPIKDSTQVLQYLYEKGYEIYIITNSPTIVVKDKLEAIDALKYIKETFSAEEAGHMKPHDEFFKVFFNKINNYEKEKMLIIGDELEKDILGGIKNKIDTCWFNPNKAHNNQYKTTYEIFELMELKKFL
ncbi:MAG: HAD hydrolase-like protein [Clostridia bacterium]|nr:HAD hydrolase-like protein [Clostridia bacterium]